MLVVSADEDRQSFNSEVFRFTDIETPAARLFQIDDWLSSMWVSPGGTCFLAGILGQCFSNVSGTLSGQKVTDKRLFRIWGLDDQAVYCVGADGTCVYFDGTQWRSMSDGLFGHLYAIAGTRRDNLLCAGDGGFVARYDGVRWNQIDLPTNAAFRYIHVVGDDDFYLCGLDGACFRLRGGQLQTIEAEAHDLYAIAEFQKEIYFGSSASGIFKIQDGKLILVKDKAKGYKVSASEKFLWTCGMEQTARFDGENWKKVDFY